MYVYLYKPKYIAIAYNQMLTYCLLKQIGTYSDTPIQKLKLILNIHRQIFKINLGLST